MGSFFYSEGCTGAYNYSSGVQAVPYRTIDIFG